MKTNAVLMQFLVKQLKMRGYFVTINIPVLDKLIITTKSQLAKLE